jgi:hypothetical protein
VEQIGASAADAAAGGSKVVVLHKLTISPFCSQRRPGRLPDAKTYAEQAFAIKKTLDPAAMEIWKTCNTLAEIAEQQGDFAAVFHYHHQERVSFAAAPACEQGLRLAGPTIAAVVKAVEGPSVRSRLEQEFAKWVEVGDREVIDLRCRASPYYPRRTR